MLVEQGKGCTIQSLSADQRGQDRAIIHTIKKQREKKVGKRVAYHLGLCHCPNYTITKKAYGTSVYRIS